MKRAHAILVVIMKPTATIGDIGELAEIIKYHDAVQAAKLHVNAPGLAKATPRDKATIKKAVTNGR